MRDMRGALAILAVVLSACGGGDAPTQINNGGGGGGGGGGGSTSNAISVVDASFEPATTTVPAGTTVTWTWNGVLTHNVTFANTTLGSSGNKTSGTYSKNFPTAGSFGYQCTIHGAAMSGTITVQ